MNLKALLAGTFVVLASTTAQAQSVNNFLIQYNDNSQGSITEKTFMNGTLIGTRMFPTEIVSTTISLGDQTLSESFDDQTNFFEPKSNILSDTAQVIGSSEEIDNNFVTVNIRSDDTGVLVPLPNGGVHFETGKFQTISTFTTGEDDMFTIQMASDIDAIPEPATWAMMLLGLGGLGAAMRATRRRSGAAPAAA